ncbi:CBS domain-containing protein [Sporolactobacillus sp. THM7-4]|nr:CBS domain-containing protein [Sporolactobacillus sp. THM7-4]
MLAKELMVKDVIAVHDTDTIKTLIQTLITHKIDGVPVLNRENKLAGFISDGDILRAVSPQPQTIYDFFTMISAVEVEMTRDVIRSVLEREVRDLMKKRGLQTILPDQDLDAVLKILSHHHFKKIPVVDNDYHVVGIISRGDVIYYIGKLALAGIK